MHVCIENFLNHWKILLSVYYIALRIYTSYVYCHSYCQDILHSMNLTVCEQSKMVTSTAVWILLSILQVGTLSNLNVVNTFYNPLLYWCSPACGLHSPGCIYMQILWLYDKFCSNLDVLWSETSTQYFFFLHVFLWFILFWTYLCYHRLEWRDACICATPITLHTV